MTNPNDTTRRGFLSTAAALAASASVAVPAVAAVAADPIFQAIEIHRQADAACDAVPRGTDIPDNLGDQCSDAFRLVMRMRPTTPAGLAALTTWTREQADQLRKNSSTLFAEDFCALSATIDDSARGMSGLKAWSPPAGEQHSDAELFAAIEIHKAARAASVAADACHSDLDRDLPADKCRSSVTAQSETIVATDDPRWIAAERRLWASYEAETDAAATLVSVMPATLPGVLALLQYAVAADPDGHSWPDLMPDDTAKLSRPWHYFLIANLSEVLPGMVQA
jgi:hypothetical protein